MTKALVLMRDIICMYHPEFIVSRDLQAYGMKYPTIFNIERLIEECLAAIGPYSFINEKGYDFTDYSDSKTTSINRNTRKAEIGSVETKIGSLRITAFNPFNNCADFFFIPKEEMYQVKRPCYGKNKHKERIVFSLSTLDNHYGYFEEFRVKTFEELALK